MTYPQGYSKPLLHFYSYTVMTSCNVLKLLSAIVFFFLGEGRGGGRGSVENLAYNTRRHIATGPLTGLENISNYC